MSFVLYLAWCFLSGAVVGWLFTGSPLFWPAVLVLCVINFSLGMSR